MVIKTIMSKNRNITLFIIQSQLFAGYIFAFSRKTLVIQNLLD